LPVPGNHFYRETPGDWLVLRIDPAKLSAAVKLERAAPVGDKEAHTADEEKKFPHLYGPLNLDAVVEEAAMDRTSSGKFLGILVCTRCACRELCLRLTSRPATPPTVGRGGHPQPLRLAQVAELRRAQ